MIVVTESTISPVTRTIILPDTDTPDFCNSEACDLAFHPDNFHLIFAFLVLDHTFMLKILHVEQGQL
jgi:hypothetical protein